MVLCVSSQTALGQLKPAVWVKTALALTGLRRKVRLFGGARHTTRLGHGAELMQLPVVEHLNQILRKKRTIRNE